MSLENAHVLDFNRISVQTTPDNHSEIVLVRTVAQQFENVLILRIIESVEFLVIRNDAVSGSGVVLRERTVTVLLQSLFPAVLDH